MNNYQLYRTNLYLGGQMKWDIIVDNSQSQLCVSDFHLSTISTNIPQPVDTTSVTYSHQYNVKTHYNKIRDDFYTAGLEPKFENHWPDICESNEIIDSYSNIFDMGCKRSKQYSKYNKQFEFFCPLWLEYITDDISFKIYIKDTSTKETIASKTLKLAFNSNNDYHNRFVKYLKNYISSVKLDVGNDDLMRIDFKNNFASITGLNTQTGLSTTHNVSNLITDLKSIERPMMELDYLLLNTFANHNILSNQLFNFNLCFNIEDILSGSVTNMMYGDNIVISVDVFMGDTMLEKRDFYTNYEYIPRDVKGDTNSKYNVLNYLHDYENIELVDKNKFDQNICHWSLTENNDYLFNLYEGFSGLTIDNELIHENEHNYGNTPNISILNYDKSQNTAGWFNNYYIPQWSEFYKYVNNTNIYKNDGTFIGNTDTNFINGLKYSYIPTFEDGIYLIGLVVDEKLLLTIKEVQNCVLLSDNLYMLIVNDLVMLLTTNINNFTFNFMKSVFSKNELNEPVKHITSELSRMLDSVVIPSVISIDNTILYNICASPNSNSKEISYYKDTGHEYVIRYDGKIKPTFTKNTSPLYYKDYVSDDNLIGSVYTKYNGSIYDPVYPSIGYCSICKLDNWSYESLPMVKVLEHESLVPLYSNGYEYTWFNDNKCLVLSPVLNFNGQLNNYNDCNIDDVIRQYISDTYSITDVKLIDYIKDLYSYVFDWDYISDTNIDSIEYNIKLVLK